MEIHKKKIHCLKNHHDYYQETPRDLEDAEPRPCTYTQKFHILCVQEVVTHFT